MRIAFGYKQRSGKDTCVDYLIKKYGGVKISFSEPLYEILHYAQRVCEFEEEKDRWFLQMVGTDWARNKNPDVWVNLALRKMKSLGEGVNVYNSDIRFKNELIAMRREGFVCIKINRDVERKMTEHISENELDGVDDKQWDYVIDNDGTVDDLCNKVNEIIFNLNDVV